jgi:hypothetical protein
MKALNYQQRKNTEQTVSKVSKGAGQQWKAVIDTAKSEDVSSVNPIAMQLAGNDGLANTRAKVIHVLMSLRREFPTSFAEATQTVNWPGVGTFAPNPVYVKALSGASAASLARSPEDQSSACLYLALKQRRRGAEFDPDTGLSSGEVFDPFNDGLKEIADGWQRPGLPIIFNRWPCAQGTGLAATYGVGVGAIAPNGPFFGVAQSYSTSAPSDPQDPEGLLANAAWLTWLQNSNNVNNFNTYVGYPGPGVALPGSNQQYKMTPVILSLGSNGKYDGNATNSDDIINFQLP